MEFKTGKLPALHDPKDRTIKFRNILNEPMLPPLPEEWEFGDQYPEFDLSPQMWRNDKHGLCVIVASYAQQREFEVIEQGKLLEVDEDQLVAQYFKESDGVDAGLYMLDHNKVWKNKGLPIGYGRKLLCLKRPLMHKIDAFARIDQTSQREMKYAMFLTGCNIGVCMPDSYAEQYLNNHPWDDINSSSNPYNGHAMKPMGWKIINGIEHVLLWTWGRKYPATWDWVLKHSDEAWAMIDSINDWMKDNSPLDMEKLRGFLSDITK